MTNSSAFRTGGLGGEGAQPVDRFAFRDDFKFGRWWGTALTFVLLLACGLLCVWQYVRATLVVGV